MAADSDDFEQVETFRLPSIREEPSLPKWLVVLGEGAARVVELRPGDALTIGRAADCEIVLPDRAASRRHATLHVGDDVQLEDLGSANGMVVSGARVASGGRTSMPPGTAAQLGTTLLVLHSGPRPPVLEAGEGPVERTRAPRPTAEPDDSHVVADEAMERLHGVIERVAPTRLNVLLLGETGVGKEILAEALHRRSPRSAAPFVKINCAALAPQLLESELFGHERGAFTGASQTRQGLLEAADGGTLLLDEVGEMPLDLQAKLLRVIEDQSVKRIGAVSPRAVDVRFVAATNRDLDAEVAAGSFRRDLYYRLNGIRLSVPPLRDRPGEIAPLARRFAAGARGRDVELGDDLLEALHRYDWPGNVRELRNAVERAAALSDGPVLRAEHLPDEVTQGGGAPRSSSAPEPHVPAPAPSASGDLREDLAAIEKRRIVEALARCDGNQTKAAKLLGMPRRTLVSRIEQYGLPRPRKGRGGEGSS